MQTGDAYRHGVFGGREEQYGLVALCTSCDDSIEAEEQKRRVQRTNGAFALVGILGMSLFLLNLGVPWWSAFLVTVLLACGGVLWWSIAT
jgi:Ca2+/Na+ antiporter